VEVKSADKNQYHSNHKLTPHNHSNPKLPPLNSPKAVTSQPNNLIKLLELILRLRGSKKHY
jgi:hypothetical protein